MNDKRIRLVIVEDEQMVSGMFQALLNRYRNLELAGCAADGEAGWELCQAAKPDLALLDIRLPKLDGLELARRLGAAFPAMRLMVMSGLIPSRAFPGSGPFQRAIGGARQPRRRL